MNPITGRREDRNRIPRALVGFHNALLVTGDQKYVDAWRRMSDAVNSHTRQVDGRTQYPTMYGADRRRSGIRTASPTTPGCDFFAERTQPIRSAPLQRDVKALADRLNAVRQTVQLDPGVGQTLEFDDKALCEYADVVAPVASPTMNQPVLVAAPRLGRRTALTLPLRPPPQKN